MKKLCTFLSLALLSVVFSSSVLAAPVMIKLAHPNVPAHPMGQGFELFKKDLEERSRGAFTVEIYDSSKFGNSDAMVQGLQMGVLQMASESCSNFSVFNPKLMMFDMPFVINSYEEADLIMDGPLGKELAKALEKNRIMGLGYIDIGFRNIFSSSPVRTLEDARNLKIRATSSKAHIAILSALGMNPTPISWGEVYTALQQKTVDAVDVDLNLGYFNKFQEITKYITLTRSFYSPHLVLIARPFFDKLTPEQQKWIQESFLVMQKFERDTIRANETMIIRKIKEGGGEIIELTPAERARWVKATAGVAPQFATAVPPSVIEEMKKAIAAGRK